MLNVESVKLRHGDDKTKVPRDAKYSIFLAFHNMARNHIPISANSNCESGHTKRWERSENNLVFIKHYHKERLSAPAHEPSARFTYKKKLSDSRGL